MTDRPWRSSDVEGPVSQPTNGWRRFFLADTSWRLLLALTVPLLVLRFVIVGQDTRVFSREMVWDLLYLLGGAWHLHAGHVPFVDFHSELGVLNFLLVDLAFKVVGTNVTAVVVAKAIVGGAIFMAATVASARRLPLVPAIVFVLLTWGMAILPTNIGQAVNEYTFAMSYNVYCWAAISVLSLILFVPPHRVAAPWHMPWIDPALAGLLIVAMYYLKITYFGAAVVELAVAFVVCGHVRAMWRTWSAVMAAVLANAVAPYNWPYLGDLMAAVLTGAATTSPVAILMTFFENIDELVIYAVAFLVGAMLWRSGRAPLRVPVGIATCVVSAIGLLSQNTQGEDLPLGLVAAFILYDCIRRSPPPAIVGIRPLWVLLAVLVMPTAIVVKQAASIVAYPLSMSRSENLMLVDHGNLKGLAVPKEKDGLLTAFADGRVDYTFLNRSREAGTSEELTQFEYVQTILEAEALLSKPGVTPGGVAVLDQVNPMPFVMNWPPPRGGSMWLAPTFPWRSAESTFAEVDYVLIPKFSTYRDVTLEAQRRFGTYLKAHFPVRSESRSWIMLRRAAK